MALSCDDGLLASFPSAAGLSPRPERGAPWRPPDTSSTTCQHCGLPGWQHRSFPPVLADEMDRAIYAAAFVASIVAHPDWTPAQWIRGAEECVEAHRSARSGT
jgi:hypothetical protein